MKFNALKPALTLLTLFLFLAAFAQKQPSAECMDPIVQVIRSSSKSIEFQVKVPCLDLYPVTTPNGEFQRLQINPRYRLAGNGNAGKPEILAFATHIAIPIGASPGTVIIEPSGQKKQKTNVRLFPVQEEETTPEGQEQKPKFVFNPGIYNNFKNDLKRPTTLRAAQQGEANIYKIAIDLMSFQPAERVISWYDSYTVKIQYKDPSDCFRLEAKPTDKFPIDQLDRVNIRQRVFTLPRVINPQDLRKYPCPWVFKPIIFGCDLLIVTPPDFLAPSQDLDVHKEARGVRTVIISTQTISDKYGDGSGNVSDTEIKEYIKWYHASAIIKPRWLLLMGDTEFIPTHYNPNVVLDVALGAGDQYYGQLNDDDMEIPALGIGRFPVDTEDQAQIIVDKVINYETTPPTGIRDEYVFAVQFQDNDNDATADREFTETAEYIRDYVITQNVDVDRVYKNKSSTSPLFYNDGSAIPADLLKPGFAWDGDSTDITDALIDGRLIAFHRDHGSKNGWSTPGYKRWGLDNLVISDNKFPLVFSINCASGLFDNETVNDPAYYVAPGHPSDPAGVYFSEKFIRQQNGAIGVFCDTRASSTSMNNLMSKGLFDAFFPNLETYGSGSKITTLGDVLNHAKGYVDASSSDDGAIERENTIYNLLGDPSLSVNGGKVLRFTRVTGLIINLSVGWAEVIVKAGDAKDQLRPLPNKKQPKLNLIPVVIQNPETGEVIGRSVTDKDGKAKVRLPKNYKGKIVVTARGQDMGMFSETISAK